MLRLKNITKEYVTGDTKVEALKGVNLEFRENEFVSILGQSGCGKTTLLNIIGGLDRYTDGDLYINGKSTKLYKDSDWDTYRNHTIGFIFQSYNLIPHQTVLSNVELALTLSGVSAEERRKRATDALEKVGLADQLNKKPNQMSGGQMQRVAIARALVNNPDILLADEPTGALDSETSVQIMELLKEIAKDRLVIMVTHNPDLAEEYSTRIIRLLDGKVIDDTAPFSTEGEEQKDVKPIKKPSMSFITALSLSLNNLMTKKTRTFLTSFAGSIGIIGIALILSLSSGVNAYIARVEEETLSSYPITIEEAGMDMSGLANDLMGEETEGVRKDAEKIYSQNIMTEMMSTMINGISANNLEAFKSHIEKTEAFSEYSSEIEYGYSTPLNIYSEDGEHINPNQIFATIMASMGTTVENSAAMPTASSPFMNTEVWHQLFDNKEYLTEQYEVVAGKFPEEYNEVVLIVNRNNQISDYTLYSLGLKDTDELKEMVEKAKKGEKIEATKEVSYTYDQILDLKFKLLVNSDYFEKTGDNIWTDRTDDSIYIQSILDDAQEIKVVGILRPSENSINSQTSGFIGYKSDLMGKLIYDVNQSEIVRYQKSNPELNVFTGFPFENNFEAMGFAELNMYISTLPEEEQYQYNSYISQMLAQGKTEEEIAEVFRKALSSQSNIATYDGNLALMGVSDINKPSIINIYPKDFEAKDSISELISQYNDKAEEDKKIIYTDYVGLMMSSVTTIINAISYILIAFVSISLIVSSIMIGIITYISVLERTKEIGILRAMGASKRDISNVFNAETLIVGFVAGTLGIIVTLLMLIPINAIIKALTDISNLAHLPVMGAIILILISMLLTFIAGLFPSKIAANKDPVTALRTE
ncbi:MAG: ABC transporter ATP-binding protein/permease [Acutalibacteraceae bacterium]|nr:ABC transporter ATP-binding protein/permease [Acutalibacteraceae bacterium]